MRILWNKNIRPEHRELIDAIINEFSWLFPLWLQVLAINIWNGDDPNQMAAVKVHYEYREACLDVYSAWLNQGPEERRRQILHEIIHLHLSLIADYAQTTFDNLCPQSEADKFNRQIQNGLRERHESATQDLADAILRFRP